MIRNYLNNVILNDHFCGRYYNIYDLQRIIDVIVKNVFFDNAITLFLIIIKNESQ